MDELLHSLLEAENEPNLAGFRLERFEVYNWGTFDQRAWAFRPTGRNALLTGDIGSGKSTLVDAITTLLVPAHRVQFNKAAGADAKERSLRSYVLGYYKSELADTSSSAKPVGLRDHNSYSVILGVFRNRGYRQTVTLAQVFWMREVGGKPERLYAVADEGLTIREHFANFGSEVAALKKRLKAQKVELFDSFSSYSAHFRRRFGIQSEQALELFHQTVSMKSVGNLTDFVRQHMLEEFEVEARIGDLIAHFDNLNRAHEAVLRARAQVEKLAPLVGDCDALTALLAEVEEMKLGRDSLKAYFGSLKRGLLEERLGNLGLKTGKLQVQIAELEETQARQERRQGELKRAISDNGGDRLERLKGEIADRVKEQERRQKRHGRYAELARTAGLAVTQTLEDFSRQRDECGRLRGQNEALVAERENELSETEFELKQKRSEHQALEVELRGLRARRSNIEQAQIETRAYLCGELGLAERDLPFAGELVQVRDDERDWEGAAERLLRNFALSLLVPERHYAQVSEWVDRTRLRGRLVYYKVLAAPVSSRPGLPVQTLAGKLELKPDTPHFGWLESELRRRFDHVCSSSIEQFRRESKAVTRAGQVKSPDGKHEKDDRHALNDRSRFVLGWSNEAKIAALDKQRRDLEAVIAGHGATVARLKSEASRLKEVLTALGKLDEYADYRELDWQPVVLEIAALEEQRAALEKASDLLRELTRQLAELEGQLTETRHRLTDERGDLRVTEDKSLSARELLAELPLPTDEQSAQFPRLEALRTKELGLVELSLKSCDAREREVREHLQGRIDSESKQVASLREKVLLRMTDFREAFPLESHEMDASVEAAVEYRALLIRLHEDDLPRFEARFKELLNENTIREIANFQSQLAKERESINERIDQINRSLQDIDYTPGRYIKLVPKSTTDAEIRDFQSELRSCTEGALTGSDEEQYSETKFLRVRGIIERFRGREGQSDLDKRWTRKVTDVRNWFTFSASERYRADDSEFDHYSDSSGKSGGQKEKLAYTILAASLVYQFNMELGTERSRSFHFVVIDEAFGRASDESAQFGLDLFRKLNIQLLIVTPLQKIHIIEPYVSCVGFVSNRDGRESLLQNLTIEEYQALKEARQT
ncbi:MAG: hypothetical protein AMXMBFR33_17740 [Candidatus Xenobia bacterium]